MIPFDLEEPIFIVESPRHKLLADFTDDGRVAWLEDLADLSYSANGFSKARK